MNSTPLLERSSTFLASWVVGIAIAAILGATTVCAQENVPSASEATNAPSKFRSPDDNWLDVSGFLEEKYGFIPVPIFVTEPAVGYGGGVGLMFLYAKGTLHHY
jgi:hypothetical protein